MGFESWSRRAFLSQLAAAAVVGPRAFALGPASQFDIGELTIPGVSVHRPEAWKRLLYEVIQSTSVETQPRVVQFSPEDPELFTHPFTVLAGDGALPQLSAGAIEQLRRYLSYGGFLFIDDTGGTGTGAFADSVRAVCHEVFPTKPLAALPADHAVYRSFFMLRRPVGRTEGNGVLEGITIGPTTPLIFCGADLSGALDRTADGRSRNPVVPGGELQRREAIKLGVNLVLYALTSNYKHDTAHVLELMREGRIE
jgi:hypothetical protein